MLTHNNESSRLFCKSQPILKSSMRLTPITVEALNAADRLPRLDLLKLNDLGCGLGSQAENKCYFI